MSGDRAVEFSVQWSLGEVVYRWGDLAITHRELMAALQARGSYPGYSADPLDGFRDLASDLAGPLVPFVHGVDKGWFSEAVRHAQEQPEPRLP